MRFRLGLAIFASIVLIGIASWYRLDMFRQVPYVSSNNLIVINPAAKNNSLSEEFLADFLGTNSTTTTPTIPNKPEVLTKTDIVSRQLLMDYITLAANGQATEAGINKLAAEYAENIPSLITTEKVTYQNIPVVPNSELNVTNYANGLGEIYVEHNELINKAYNETLNRGSVTDVYTSFARNAATIYRNTYSQLKELQVPISISQLHLELINTELSTVAAMESIRDTNEDSLKAFAGFVSMNENLNKEIDILKEIEKNLSENEV